MQSLNPVALSFCVSRTHFEAGIIYICSYLASSEIFTPKITQPSHKTATYRTHTPTISHDCNKNCNILQPLKKTLQPIDSYIQITYLCSMKNYQTSSAEGQKCRLEQLLQLLSITSDGDLINKLETQKLKQMGYCMCSEGFTVISAEGIKLLYDLGLIHP